MAIQFFVLMARLTVVAWQGRPWGSPLGGTGTYSHPYICSHGKELLLFLWELLYPDGPAVGDWVSNYGGIGVPRCRFTLVFWWPGIGAVAG